MNVRNVPAHFHGENRYRQREPDPKPPAHIDKLGAALWRCRGHIGLERHAADRASSGPELPHLGMHRTGVDGACGEGRRPRLWRNAQVFLRIGCESAQASGGAKVISLPGIVVTALAGARIHRHSADRIARLWFLGWIHEHPRAPHRRYARVYNMGSPWLSANERAAHT